MFLSAFAVTIILNRSTWPNNYFIVFLLAAIFLLFASLGFWRVKEVIADDQETHKYKFTDLWKELITNKRLIYFLFSINVLGLGQGLMPFIMLYANNSKVGTEDLVGNLLIAKTLGLILSGLVLYKRAQKLSYKKMMWFLWALAIVFPLSAWIFSTHICFYYISFFLGGIFLTLYIITNSGVLLEISNTKNRALYTGIAGAGNILPVLFPLLGGSLIALTNFNVFFIFYIALSATGIYFLYKMDCQK